MKIWLCRKSDCKHNAWFTRWNLSGHDHFRHSSLGVCRTVGKLSFNLLENKYLFFLNNLPFRKHANVCCHSCIVVVVWGFVFLRSSCDLLLLLIKS